MCYGFLDYYGYYGLLHCYLYLLNRLKYFFLNFCESSMCTWRCTLRQVTIFWSHSSHMKTMFTQLIKENDPDSIQSQAKSPKSPHVILYGLSTKSSCGISSVQKPIKQQCTMMGRGKDNFSKYSCLERGRMEVAGLWFVRRPS